MKTRIVVLTLVSIFFSDRGLAQFLTAIPGDTIVIVTNSITGISKNTATSGGNIISDGGAAITSRGVCWSTSPNPDTTNSITKDGSGAGNYITEITELVPNTTYYLRAYAINSFGVGYGNELSFTTVLPEIIYGSISDEGGNVYKTVKIGSQIWMAENLRSVAGCDGKSSPLIEDGILWGSLSTPAYCWYNNDLNNRDTYGALFNYYVIDSRHICPSGGWHVPSMADWMVLEDYMGGANVAGGQMKESGTMRWNSPNMGATDLYGFSALPAGMRYLEDGRYTGIGSHSFFWSSTSTDSLKAWALYLRNDCIDVAQGGYSDKTSGYSIRCLMDSPDSISQVDLQKGLVAYYPFNGNANDESGNGHHGTANGGTLTTDRFGNANSAYTFTGEPNTLSFSGFQLTIPFTISGWVKITDENSDTIFQNTSPAGLKVIIRIVNHRYQVEFISGKYKFILYDENGIYEIDSQHPRSDFLMLDYSHTYLQFYINNRHISIQNTEGKITQPIFPITMNNNIVYSFKGIMDDIRMYNRQLNSEEMQVLYFEEVYPHQLPTLTTKTVNCITQTSALIEGIINSDGGAGIIAKGFCWSTSPNPDTTNNKTIVGGGVGNFVSNLAGLIPNTTYYVKSYAINTTGLVYGNELIFKTLGNVEDSLKKGLIAYYPFNGNANDESGNGLDGTVKGAKLAYDRLRNANSAYYFDGSGDYIIIDSAFFNIGWDEYSISCWVNSVTWKNNNSLGTGNQPIINTIPYYGFEMDFNWGNSNKYNISINSNPAVKEWDILNKVTSNTLISINKWNHLVLVKEFDKYKLYVNGILDSIFTGSVIPANYQCKIVLGSIDISIKKDEYFKGELDDYRIYNRALNDLEIKALCKEKGYLTDFPEITAVVCNVNPTTATCVGKIEYYGSEPITEKGLICFAFESLDTVENITIVNKDSNNFEGYITELTPNTVYYVKAYAVNTHGIAYGNSLSFRTSPDLNFGSVTDVEGNVYKTIQIGTHNWMAENLRTTRYNDGSPIPNVTDNFEWSNLNFGAYCWYNNNEYYKNGYGGLYNYYTITDSRQICPTNWHIPTPEEWATLPDSCYEGDDGFPVCGTNLLLGRTNTTGFSAGLEGLRQGLNIHSEVPFVGIFRGIGMYAFFWKSTGDFFFLSGVSSVINIYHEWLFHRSPYNGYSIRCIEDIRTSITIPDSSVFRNMNFEIPVYVHKLPADESISYQFDLSFNADLLQYQGYNLDGTLSSDGSIQVKHYENKLSIAWAGQTPLADSGTILKLQFKALETGATMPILTNCLVNTDTVRNIVNGTITINPCYGDIDDNGNIQAYDAALALQYSVGLDPLPEIDPVPWEDWRVTSANTDGLDAVSAYDASLILQYTVGLINSFPVHGLKKSSYAPQSEITVSVENEAIIFRSDGDVYGLNLSVEENCEMLGVPQVMNTNMLVETNITSSVYLVGLATAYPTEDDEVILKIPLIETITQPVRLAMKINDCPKQIELFAPTAIFNPIGNAIEMYPNPANIFLYFRNLVGETFISIFDLQGRKIASGLITNNQFDISDMENGLYTVKIECHNKIIIKKLVKQ